jgi:ABC-type multidrug transport system ATPase subunit
MIALFRLVELDSGCITIDGVPISSLGLAKLRESMAIIPQDPILYSGSVRTNLDPFSQYSEEQIWDALRKAHLAQYIESLDGQLNAGVAEGGENFSAGQKCQICLARALLKNAKILILDEATASIDNATDSLIQLSLRTHFTSCTILTIAHRLATVMDYELAMVLDFGHIKEFDTPANLLRKGMEMEAAAAAAEAGALDSEKDITKEAIFYSLVKETGPQTSELLKKLAFDAEVARSQQKEGSPPSEYAGSLQELQHRVWVTTDALRESSRYGPYVDESPHFYGDEEEQPGARRTKLSLLELQTRAGSAVSAPVSPLPQPEDIYEPSSSRVRFHLLEDEEEDEEKEEKTKRTKA